MTTLLELLFGEVIAGDLIEEYAIRAASESRFAASRWLASQAIRSLPFVIGKAVVAAIGAYVAGAIVKIAADFAIARVAGPTTRVILAPILFIAAAAIAGGVAARIRRGAPFFLALLVLVTVIVLINVRICTIPVPWWYPLSFLTLGPLAVVTAPLALERQT